jgi:hypothetical protein
MKAELLCTVKILFGCESLTCRPVHIYTRLRSNEIDNVSLLEDPLQLHLWRLPDVSEMKPRGDRASKSAIVRRNIQSFTAHSRRLY